VHIKSLHIITFTSQRRPTASWSFGEIVRTRLWTGGLRGVSSEFLEILGFINIHYLNSKKGTC